MAVNRGFFHVRRQILREIMLAQIASDSGKGIKRYRIRGDKNTFRGGYKSKIRHILRALSLIDSIPYIGIAYWVDVAPDQNGYSSILCTFYISKQITGTKRTQIGFHTPFIRATDEYKSYIKKGRKGHWDKKSVHECFNELQQVLDFIYE